MIAKRFHFKSLRIVFGAPKLSTFNKTKREVERNTKTAKG